MRRRIRIDKFICSPEVHDGAFDLEKSDLSTMDIDVNDSSFVKANSIDHSYIQNNSSSIDFASSLLSL